MRRVAFVLWNGNLGGAERHTLSVCRALARGGIVEPHIVFVEHEGAIGSELTAAGIEHVSLGYRRGTQVLGSPWRLAAALREHGDYATILVYGGYLAVAARVGGYRATLIAVEHGGILHGRSMGAGKKLWERLSRWGGARALSGVVAVSDYVRDKVINQAHPAMVRTIYNGLELDRYQVVSRSLSTEHVVVGFVGRLVSGKGVIDLVDSFETSYAGTTAELRIAGDGPLRDRVEERIRDRGLTAHVNLCGWVDDVSEFWAECDVAVHLSNGLPESFCLSIAEAMACGVPAVVSSEGALPEIVRDMEVGCVIPAGDALALKRVLTMYASLPELRERHGAAGRARCVEWFDISATAREYLAFIEGLDHER